MTPAEAFSQFLTNLAISNAGSISGKYQEITATLNKAFRDTESKTANTLQVGSYGRKTGINGISDLDMLYIMPASQWVQYKNGGHGKLLRATKEAISARYPKTSIKVDRLVVTVTYTSFHVEVQPVFQQSDGSFLYPDTKGEGSWKVTKPVPEINATRNMDTASSGTMRDLCKMTRAWKNKHGVGMGGLVIDTLVHNFLRDNNEYQSYTYKNYGELVSDFFQYLYNLPKQDRYHALGSGQHVRLKKHFQRKAKKAFRLASAACEAEGQKNYSSKWKKVFGRPFPSQPDVTKAASRDIYSWRNTEEFIENKYPIDVRYNVTIGCDVKQDGFRPNRLRAMIAKNIPLLPRKKLIFKIEHNDVPAPYSVEWKVLNRGEEAKRRDKIRGQIVKDAGQEQKSEPTWFKGDHVVECYIIKNGVVVATDRIHVPIAANATE